MPSKEALEITDEDIKTVAIVRPSDSFMLLVEKLKNMPPEAIGAVLDSYERFLKIQAKQAYDLAMAELKKNIPSIVKTKLATVIPKDSSKQGYSYKYAPLEEACDKLDPVLSAHGFSYRWDTEPNDKGVVIVCVLTHLQGHSEKTTLPPAPHDNSGGKNPIQAIGSTISYIQRYSLLAALGIAPRGVDNDGKGSQQPKQGSRMDADELAERDAHFDKCLSYQEVDAHYGASFKEAHELKDQNAKDTFIAAKKRAYARLREKQ